MQHFSKIKSIGWLVCGAVLTIFWTVTPTWAQGGMIPVPREVNVIKTNPQLEARPGFAGSILAYLGYDTNISYGSGDDTLPETQFESVVPGLSLALTPSIRWTSAQLHESSRDAGKLHYGFEISGTYRQMYSPDKSGIYNDPRFGAHVGGVLFYSPSPMFHFQVYEMFDRYSEPHYMIRDTFTQSWDSNQLGVLARVVPGDGLLETVLRYNLGVTYFEDSLLKSANKLEHNFQLRASYKFLPQSQLWLVATYDMNSYFENGSVRDSTPIKLSGGVSTPLWTSLALSLGGGYGWGMYSSGPSPDTWLAFAGLNYSISARLKAGFLYSHTFEDSVLGSYSDQNNFSLNLTSMFGQKLMLQGQVGYRHLEFFAVAHVAGGSGDDIRVDDVFFADLTLSYKLRPDLFLRAQYKFMTDQTPYRATTPVNPDPDPNSEFPLSIVNNPSFIKQELFLTLAWHF